MAEAAFALGLSAVFLAAVFATAAIAKLLDPRGSRAAVKAFGVPDRLASAVAGGLPIAEIGIGALLLPAATRWYAAAAALGLLLAFCAGIVRVMIRGEAPDCHCFGALHSAPTGWSTLGRTGGLALLAAFLVVAGRDDTGPGISAWKADLNASEWLLLGLAAALVGIVTVGGYAVLHVMRNYGKVLVRLEKVEEQLRSAGFELEDPDDMPELGLAPGIPAPPIDLASIDGGRVSLDNLREFGNPVLLLFTSPTCGPCSHLMPTVAEWQQEHADELTVALVSSGDPDAVRSDAEAHGLANVLLDDGSQTFDAYEANGTPSAVLIGDDGTVAAWLAAGSDWIESLVAQALSGLGRTPGLPVGSELPELELKRLDGGEIPLRDAIERDSVLLFWNPGCGFCRSLHEELLAWEEAPPEWAPALLVVSAGEAVSVKAESFASEVLLDPEWKASSALGADGTPMAVLVSADGRIASSVVGGGPAVLELLGAGALAESR
ncbi:MAG TPA: TlpA disulfide reductase family protein [Gaiellaceae bacterium]|nr:TlpA disulfide reductase family protein [Gaiellaceae bacterium]